MGEKKSWNEEKTVTKNRICLDWIWRELSRIKSNADWDMINSYDNSNTHYKQKQNEMFYIIV